MTDFIPDTVFRRLMAAALAITFFIVFSAYIYFYEAILDRWQYADWVIHYGEGFVRRGLMGEIVLFLGGAFSLSLPFCVLAINIVLCAASAFFLYKMLRDQSLLVMLVYISPLFFGFYLLDAWSASRKEFLLIPFYMGLCWYSRDEARRCFMALVFFLLSLAVFVFMHEGLFFFYALPAFSVLLLSEQWRLSLAQKIALCVLGLLITACFVFIALQPPLQMDQLAGICSTLESARPPSCYERSAIEALTRPAALILSDVAISYYLAILAVVWLFWGFVLHGHRLAWGRLQIPLIMIYLVSYMPIIMLALFAKDWGRWIALHNVLFISFLYLHRPGAFADMRRAVPVFLLVGMFVFRAPVCCTARPGDFFTPAYIYQGAAQHLSIINYLRHGPKNLPFRAMITP